MKPCSRAFSCRTTVLLVLLLTGNADGAEEKFSVDLQADRMRLKVADPVWVTVSATAPTGWKIKPPDAPDAFGELKVIEVVEHLEESDDGTSTATTRLQLESLLPGRYQVGPLDVRFVFDNGDSDSSLSAETIQRSTESLTIRIESALGLFEGRQLRDINDTVRTPWTWRQWTVATMAISAVVMVGAAVYRGVARGLRSQRINQRSLLQQLDRLDEARLSRSISHDQLIISVAEVVRQSLRIAEGTPSAYRTTNEWLDYLERRRFADGASSKSDPNPFSDAVKLVLREADAIKFAGKAATLDQARRSLDAARRIIQLNSLRIREFNTIVHATSF